MTIRKGEAWGTPVTRSDNLRVARSDAELAELTGCAELADAGIALSVSGGDLFQSLGKPESRANMIRVDVDIIEVATDNGIHRAVANVIARRSYWVGSMIGVFNVSEYGPWNPAPRAHPNDGLADIVEVASTMSLRDRLAARQRLRTGAHLPHPDIGYRRASEERWTFQRNMDCFVDGRKVGRTKTLAIRVIPDAFVLDY